MWQVIFKRDYYKKNLFWSFIIFSVSRMRQFVTVVLLVFPQVGKPLIKRRGTCHVGDLSHGPSTILLSRNLNPRPLSVWQGFSRSSVLHADWKERNENDKRRLSDNKSRESREGQSRKWCPHAPRWRSKIRDVWTWSIPVFFHSCRCVSYPAFNRETAITRTKDFSSSIRREYDNFKTFSL